MERRVTDRSARGGAHAAPGSRGCGGGAISLCTAVVCVRRGGERELASALARRRGRRGGRVTEGETHA